MGRRAFTYEEVTCDHPGCEATRTGQPTQAWVEVHNNATSEGWESEGINDTDKQFCPDHITGSGLINSAIEHGGWGYPTRIETGEAAIEVEFNHRDELSQWLAQNHHPDGQRSDDGTKMRWACEALANTGDKS